MTSKSVEPNKSDDECQNKNENLEGSVWVEENLQVAGNSTSESVVEMTNGASNKIEGRESSKRA